MQALVEQFKSTYADLGSETLFRLRDLYSPGIHFIDPLREIHGIDPLMSYCEGMYRGVESCRFTFEETLEGPAGAMITWTMRMRHRTFRPGSTLELPGATFIRFSDRVTFHRDYYDLGAMIYERIPLLGGVIRAVKRRIEG